MALEFYTNTFMDSDRIESDRKGNTAFWPLPCSLVYTSDTFRRAGIGGFCKTAAE